MLQLESVEPKQKKFSYHIETLGCKANTTDSTLLASRLEKFGGVRASMPEVYILNSCTVTDRADREAIALIKKQKAKVCVLTGCLAEVDPGIMERIEKESGKKIILARNSGKADLPAAIAEWAAEKKETSQVISGDRSHWHKNIDHEEFSIVKAGIRTRAFLKVQDGCNQFCSYCIIPHARGRSRSLSVDQILTEVSALEDAGVHEVVLTAIHAADYESAGLSFTTLVKKVLQATAIERVRLTSLDPAEISSELLDLMANEPRLCSHLHVSLQSGSSRVLQAMQRNYNAERAQECLKEICEKVPNVFIGMDMIAGFPGETKEDHLDTINLLRNTPWTKLHVFPFSPRRSTKAAQMVEMGMAVPGEEKARRARELRELSEERIAIELGKKVGKLMEVLVEEKRMLRDGVVYSHGHARNYFSVIVRGELVVNSLARVEIIGVDYEGVRLVGEIV